MTREEYFICLESYLKDLSLDECREALDYYQNYFDEAGPDKEEEVIEKLGSPKQLAETILNSEGVSENASYGTASEKKSSDNEVFVASASRADGNNFNNANNNYNNTTANNKKTNETDSKTLKIIIAIIVIIIAFPVIASIGGAGIGIVCALGFGGAGLVLAGVTGAVGSLVLMFRAGFGLGLMGVGVTVMLAAVGLFCLFLLYVICKYLVPVCIDGIKKLWDVIVN